MATSDFNSPVDIANRALQRCGAARITTFDDDSKNAAAVKFVYDKVRKAELRRNVWRFAVRKCVLRPVDTTTLTVVFADYDATKTYVLGSVVLYEGELYYALDAVPVSTPPPDNPTYWSTYFGQKVATPWTDETTYFAGDIVYYPATTEADVYISLGPDNADDPTEVPAWDATVTYKEGDTVTHSAVVYQSTSYLNLNETPSGVAPWVTVPTTQVTQMMGQKWLKLDATLKNLVFTYPAGTGPSSNEGSRNVYILPAGYLREAPQDPKAGSTSFLGAPSGLAYTDWTFEGNLIVSREVRPILFRFVADIGEVTRMDPMFCEGFACRIAVEIVEELTQSDSKLSNIASIYGRFMNEARTVNGIETGPTEPPEDDWISCRA